MASKKDADVTETAPAAPQGKQDANVNAALRVLGNKLDAVIRALENVWGVDIDQDGKVGAARIGAVLISLALACAASVIAYGETLTSLVDNDASQTEVWNVTGDGDGTATATLTGSLTVSETVTASGVIDGVPSAGAAVTSVTATESYGQVVKTVLAVSDLQVILNGSASAPFGSAKLYDFPAGVIHVLSVMVDDLVYDTLGTGNDGADGGDFSLGFTATSDATLDGTDVGLLASTSLDPLTNAVDAVQVVDIVPSDGTSTAKDLYLNLIIDDADVGAVSVTNTIDATVTINWLNAGDK